jgi:hypothetical protein
MELLPVLGEIRRGQDDQFDTKGDGGCGGKEIRRKEEEELKRRKREFRKGMTQSAKCGSPTRAVTAVQLYLVPIVYYS